MTHFELNVITWLSSEHAIGIQEENLFSFAIRSLIWGLLPVCFSSIIGLFLNMFIESLIMITPFMLLRKFTGGFHFQSAKVCLAITVVVLTCGMLLQKLVLKANNSNMLTIIVALSTVIILIFSPIKSSSAMHNKNYLFFRKMSRALSFFSFLQYLILHYCTSDHFAIAFGIGIFLVALSQLPCIIKEVL